MLEKLDRIARDRNTSVSAITWAWLRQQKTVATPIASATKLEQIKELMPVIALSGSDLQELTNS
jgi:aryl-alcohol dehydrogenase-like predicted oxidoreductase